MGHAESRYERLERLGRLLAGRPAGWRTAELGRELGVDADTVRRCHARRRGASTPA